MISMRFDGEPVVPPREPEKTDLELPEWKQAQPKPPRQAECGTRTAFAAFKNLRVLLVAPLSDSGHPAEGQSIPEALRLLVKELIVVKAYEGFSNALTRLHPDVLLLLGGNEPVSSYDLDAIQLSGTRSAVWIDDEQGLNDALKRVAQAFDYVFSQHQAHLAAYRQAGCIHADYLPFPADPEVFTPQPCHESDRCDILVIGDAESKHEEHIRVIRDFSGNLRVLAMGSGWEKHSIPVISAPSSASMQGIYNRAGTIIQWEPVQRRVFEAAACGVFQLVEASADLFKYMEAGSDVVPFQDAAELGTRLTHYAGEIDQRRKIASQALWRSHYDYSPLHMAMELLQTMLPAPHAGYTP